MTLPLPIITPDDIETLEKLRCTPDEIGMISRFLEPFHPTGRIYGIRVFIRGLSAKKTLADILTVCERVFQEIWSVGGDTDQIGNPDDQKWGLANTAGFATVYQQLGVRWSANLAA